MWKEYDFTGYEVSEDGEIRNMKTGIALRQFEGKDGYMRTQFAGKTRLVHRVVADCFISTVKGKDFVNHIDGNKMNNNASNLEWCTRNENMKHAYDHSLKSSKGVKNGRCKLTEDDVKYIREHYIKGDNVFGEKGLANKFGVARQTIGAVITGQNWTETLPYAK